MKKKLETKNFIWSTIGSVIFGFTSLFFMVIVTRINGMEIAGAYTYAFACACIFCAIGSYSGKTFQITETNEEYTDSDYLYSKVTTCFIMNLFAVGFCILTHPGLLKSSLILLLTAYRSVDAFIDSIHAIVQRNGELYKVGQSMLIRTILLVILFIIVDYITKNIIITCISLLLGNALYGVLVDFPKIKGKYQKTKYEKKKNINLLKAGFAVFLSSFLTLYILNATKYAINKYEIDTVQAVFGIIIMPASFLALISQYLVQPFLNTITECIKKEEYKQLRKKIISLSSFLIIVGALAILFCGVFGIPILELVYGVSLEGQRNNLLLILVGSILHSLVILLTAIFIADRKTVTQLFLLIVTSILSYFICDYFIAQSGIDGASISYLVIMTIELFFHLIALLFLFKPQEKKVTMRLMGGLGNQMFEYATLRSMMLKYNQKGCISLKGITNKTHNVYSLDYFTINKEINIINKETLKSKMNYLLYGFYCVFLVKRKNGFLLMKKIQPLLNHLGMYCVPDGFIPLMDSKVKKSVMVGYYQSLKYFNEYKDILRKELKVKTKVLKQNEKLLEEIKKNNSICVHIRRGDYVGSNHQVCNEAYYKKAIEIMKEKVKNPKFYIFSDDITWVKENMTFLKDAYFVEGQNPNYEELRLMYSCKHFIISNSSFSWWAQYLTDNKKRITIAPNKWFQNEFQKVDIYEDDWIKIEV